jgi:hypothetical protein
MESTNILQEEDDENISMEEEVCEEEKEYICQPKLGDVLEPLKMKVTLKLKTQFPFMKIHTLLVR